MLLVSVFLLAYAIPAIILDCLQMRHIKKAITQKAILLDTKEYIKAGSYSVEKLKLNILSKITESALFAFWILFGLDFFYNDKLNMLSGYYRDVAFVMLIVLISLLVGLPSALYETFSIDKRYGFCKQTPALFLLDTLKSSLLGLMIGGGIVFLLLWVMNNFTLWWIGGFVLLFCFIILANAIYPTLIAPMFNKFTPLQDTQLKERIESLMQKVGFQSSGIFVMDASKRDGRLNAYFGGLGNTKRVVLFDTLLEKISQDGLLAILGHELGHFKHKDIIKNIAIMGVFLFLLFFLASHLPESFFSQSHLPEQNACILALVILLSPIVSFWFMPIIGYFSRKAEYGADAFGASLISKSHLANALVRLVEENKSFPSSHSLYIFFYYSHPPLLERLKALDYEALK